MIQCKKCDAVIPNKAKFCTECGTQVPDNIKFCPNCHTDMPEGAKFCVDCGTRVSNENGRSISALLIFIILIGVGLVIYRSINLPTNKTPQSQTYISTKSNSEPYSEVSFHTMVFRDKPRHEIELDISSPTTQALISEYVNEWLTKNKVSEKIKEGDEVRIDAYEKNELSGETNLRAKFINIDTDLNPDYKFPAREYSNIGDNLYVDWVVKQAS